MNNEEIQEKFETNDEVGYVFDAIREDTLVYAYKENKEDLCLYINEEYDHISAAKLLERSARKIIHSTGPAVSIKPGLVQFNPATGNPKHLCSTPIFNAWGSILPNKAPSPYVKLLIDSFDIRDWHTYPWNACLPTGEICADYCNRVINEIRKKSKLPIFLKEIERWNASVTKNFQSMEAYIFHLFNLYSRLLVVRLDIGYRKGSNGQNTPTTIKTDLSRLFNNSRHNNLFQTMIGYIWRIEFGKNKGFHAHLLLFFDGSKSREDITLGDAIGAYWRNSTLNKEGTYWNCNRQKNGYKALGIGMISYNDEEKRQNLLKALTYLTKADRYMRIALVDHTPGFRRIGRGEVKGNPSTKRGRPRRSL